MRTWVLVYTRAGARLPWLVITGVPAGVKRAAVMDALETWRRWQAFAPGPSGRLSLVLLERVGTLHGDVATTQAIEWGELAPETVKQTVELPGRVHAQVVRAARRRGLSQLAWMVEVIDAASSAELGVS